ncbi:MAG: acyl carrier protein [Succinivibrio sp.]|nr:acyl carrier protein [Succinivibrio sp.]
MPTSEIRRYVLDYLERSGPLPPENELDSFNFLGSGYIDSLALFAFLLSIKKDLGAEIKPEELIDPRLATVGGLCAAIENKLNESHS